jgi:acyl-CoA synthetase (NDP forming)
VFFRQYGIVRVDDLDELLETAALFTRLQRPAGEGLCVYAISGGTGAHMADLCAWGGLELPTLTEESQQRLREAIPDYLTVSNPVDNGAQVVRKGGLNKQCIDICLDDPNVDILVCPITGILPSMSKIVAGDIVDAYKEAKKPVIVIWGSPVTDEEGYRILVEGGVPMFRSFRSFVVGLRRYLDYWRFLERFEERPIVEERVPAGFETMLAGTGALSEYDSASLAAQYGVPFPMSALCETEEQAVGAAAKLGETVVMKACGSGVLHKTDAGLVRVGVPRGDVAATFRELDERGRAHAGDAGYDGVLVQALADGDFTASSSPGGGPKKAPLTSPSREVIVGFSDDPQFGPVVLFGLGGVFVEVLKDVSLRVAPLTRSDADEMIREVKGFPLLDGARGLPKADVDALADLLLKVSQMAGELRGRVSEFDLNPVWVRPVGEGLVALDALVVRSAGNTR